MSSFRDQVRLLVADRHSAEARALYELVLRYAEKRVHGVASACWQGMFGSSELDEIVAEVLYQLVSCSLATFRGETPGELFGFVRTICDRTLWRSAHRRLRERDALEASPEEIEAWNAHLSGPEEAVRLVPETPLSEDDQSYLRDLLAAGSKVEHARRSGVSRAAVTQRVQRIRGRIARMSPDEQMAVDAWLTQAARQALECGPPN
jgi:hypothetical protein